SPGRGRAPHKTRQASPGRNVGTIDAPCTATAPGRHRAHRENRPATGEGSQITGEGVGRAAPDVPDRRQGRRGVDRRGAGTALSDEEREDSGMSLLHPKTTVSAHCDLPCGVYDPAQARIEAQSVKAIQEKYQGNSDPVFRTRALIIKEERAQLVKHHLW